MVPRTYFRLVMTCIRCAHALNITDENYCVVRMNSCVHQLYTFAWYSYYKHIVEQLYIHAFNNERHQTSNASIQVKSNSAWVGVCNLCNHRLITHCHTVFSINTYSTIVKKFKSCKYHYSYFSQLIEVLFGCPRKSSWNEMLIPNRDCKSEQDISLI